MITNFSQANFSNNVLAQDYAASANARPDFIKNLKVPAIDSLQGARGQELVKVLDFINASYGSHTLMQYLSVINDPKDLVNHGRVTLNIPQSAFFGVDPGMFQLRCSWPEVNEANVLVAKITLNYRIDPSTFENVLLMPGGGNGDPQGWTNINSAQIPVHELIHPQLGFIAEGAREDVIRFCRDKLNQPERATLTLTPQSHVTITLRNTIVPVANRRVASGRRQITPNNNKQAGDDAGLGMASIWFQGATVLPRISPLVKPNDVKVDQISAHDLFAQFGMARPTASYDADTSVAAHMLVQNPNL